MVDGFKGFKARVQERHLFNTNSKVVDGKALYMGNNFSIKVNEKGQVELVFSSGNILILRDVYYAPKISRNLVFRPTLNHLGYMLVLECDWCFIFKNSVYVGSFYLINNLFKLYLRQTCDGLILNVVNDYSFCFWHDPLCHVNYNKMLHMSKHEIIPMLEIPKDKCHTCMLKKIIRTPFRSAERNTQLLELIHCDLCDFHSTPSLGNKKYVILL